MLRKPSDLEDEYFARQEIERRRKEAVAREAKIKQEERARLQALHFMKCPKCGMDLEEIAFGDIKVDKCFECEGLWLDKGEMDAIQTKEAGFIGRLLSAFRA